MLTKLTGCMNCWFIFKSRDIFLFINNKARVQSSSVEFADTYEFFSATSSYDKMAASRSLSCNGIFIVQMMLQCDICKLQHEILGSLWLPSALCLEHADGEGLTCVTELTAAITTVMNSTVNYAAGKTTSLDE